MTTYFISGYGVNMPFNASIYQNPDSAAIEEGQRLAGITKNVIVKKIVGTTEEVLYRSATKEELCQQRLAKIHFTPCKRTCTC